MELVGSLVERRPHPFKVQVRSQGAWPAEDLRAGQSRTLPPEEALQGLGLVGFPPLSTHLPGQGLTFPYTNTSKRMPKALRSVRYSLPFSIL